jgi:hypothetical protein
MLNPNLQDWWTKNHITDLSVDKDGLCAAGISVKVFIDGYIGDDYNLYSIIEGEYEDNLRVFCVDKKTDTSPDKVAHSSDTSPICKWYGDIVKLNEFKVTASFRDYLNFPDTGDIEDFYRLPIRNYKYRVNFHDNFIVYFSPPGPEETAKWLKAIFDVHSFYYGYDIDWTLAIKRSIELLKDGIRLRIRSYPEKGKTLLLDSPSSTSWLGRLFGKKGSEEFIIKDKVAIFNANNFIKI